MFQLDEGMDTGPILGQMTIPVDDDETSATLYEKVVASHRTLSRRTYPGIADGTVASLSARSRRRRHQPVDDAADLVRDARAGLGVEPENPECLASAFRAMADLSLEERHEMGDRRAAHFARELSADAGARRLKRVLIQSVGARSQ